MQNVDSKSLLDAMTVLAHKLSYAIGCFEKRITIYSQQIRAFNLCHALIKEKKIGPESEVAIIGGGISSVTFAAACSSKGIRVVIFERASQLMHMQRGETQRYIHPNIYDWPNENSLEGDTDLPFLNWKAGKTNHVINSIDAGFDRFKNKIRIRTDCEVSAVIEKTGHVQVELNTKIDNKLNFPIVIYAGGFGIEKNDFKKRNSYWRCESLHQEELYDSRKKIIIIGTGDGGLIDCQRATMADFDHQRSVDTLTANHEFTRLGRDIAGLEQNIYSITDQKDLFEKLEELYLNYNFPNDIMTLVCKERRKDVDEVILVGKSATPLSLNTSLLNRICVFILHFRNLLEYKSEDFTKKMADDYVSRGFEVFERCGTEPFWVSFFKTKMKPDWNDQLNTKRQLLEIARPGEIKYWNNDHEFFVDIPVEKLEKKIIGIKCKGQASTWRLLAKFETDVTKMGDSKNIKITLKTLEIDPIISQYASNRDKIREFVSAERADFIMFLNSDLLEFAKEMDGDAIVIMSGEPGLLTPVWKERKSKYPTQVNVGIALTTDIPGIIKHLNTGFSGKKIGYVYDPDYETDEIFFRKLQTVLAANSGGKKTFELIGIAQSFPNADALTNCDIYLGRYFVHKNKTHFLQHKPFPTGFSVDLDYGAFMTYDAKINSSSDYLVRIIEENLFGKSQSKDFYTTKKPLLTINKTNAAKFHIDISELKAAAMGGIIG